MSTSGAGYAGTAAQSGGNATWANLSYAQGAPDGVNFATWTNAGSSNTGVVRLSGYGAQAGMIGGIQPVSIDKVTLVIPSYVSSTTYISALTVQLIGASSGALGSPTTLTRSVTTTNTQTVEFTTNLPTWADLSNLIVEIVATHNVSTTSATYSLDGVKMTIAYTGPVAPNRMLALQDSFDADLDRAQWWAYPNWQSSNGDELVFTPAVGPPTTPDTWQYMACVEPFDLRESAVSMKVTPISGATTDIWWGVNATSLPFTATGGGDSWNRALYFRLPTNGNLDGVYEENGINSDAGSTTYASGSHLYQRIRQHGNYIYYDVSGDNITYTNLWRITLSASPGSHSWWYVFVRCPFAASGTSLFNNLNIRPGRIAGRTVAGLAGGSGSWAEQNCVLSTPNGTHATWTVPAS